MPLSAHCWQQYYKKFTTLCSNSSLPSLPTVQGYLNCKIIFMLIYQIFFLTRSFSVEIFCPLFRQRNSTVWSTMDQVSIKTPNPKCRLFLKIYQQRYLAAGVYLSEATDPLPLPPPCYTHEKVGWALVHKRDRKYQHD